MKELLLSERYRPKDIEDIILLPRVKKIFEDGLKDNVILYGHYGTGKTSLARILIGKYTKDKPFIEINTSYYTSIDTLRTKIDDFCSKVYMGFDLSEQNMDDSVKYVFLDEFERASPQYQDSLKAYIEDYSAQNVRFILNTNHLNKISDGIKSRFQKVNFDAISQQEEIWLKKAMFDRINNNILIKENIEVDRDIIVKIIKKNYPDFRSTMISLESFIKNGNFDNDSNIDNEIRNKLYNIVYNSSLSYNDIYHFLMDNFGAEKIDSLIKLFGSQFINYVIENKPNDTDKLFKSNYIISENTQLLETATDPIILGMTIIGKMRDLFTT